MRPHPGKYPLGGAQEVGCYLPSVVWTSEGKEHQEKRDKGHGVGEASDFLGEEGLGEGTAEVRALTCCGGAPFSI